MSEQKENELMLQDCRLPKIDVVCKIDEEKINFRLIEIKNNIATATNGSVVVKCDLTMTTKLTPDMLNILNGKYIHKEVWAEMSKCDYLHVDNNHITCTNDGINRIFEYSNPQGEFFNINQIIQEIKENGEEMKRVVCYNPNSISLVSKVFAGSALNFSFSKGNRGTVVYPYDGCGMFAIIMPQETNENRYLFT